MSGFSVYRLLAFMKKESIQVVRDPSSIIIAFVLPLLMIFLFAYGVSLDTNVIKIGVVLEDSSPIARDLADAFAHTPYFQVTFATDRKQLTQDLRASKIRGIVIIPQDFSTNWGQQKSTPVQVIADGSETNTASFVENYAQGVISTWALGYQTQQGLALQQKLPSIIADTRVWFNAQLKSRNVILPGSMAVIMALIGTLLTALVVAREWERGSMEAILATPIHVSELIIGKMIPYFMLGMASMALCVSLAVFVFGVPFEGSVWVLALATAIFLLAGLSQGLLISIISKNQFVASQTAINAAFLPAYMLSGFLYEIQAMPLPLRLFTYLFAPRYFVTIIQTNFLAGVIWAQIIPALLAMLLIASFFLFLVIRKSRKSLE